MNRLVVILSLFLLVSCKKDNSETMFSLMGEAQGTTYGIKYISEKERITKTEIDSIFQKIDASLSTYKPDSDISKINAGDTTVVVDEHFKKVLEASKEIYQASNGIFDPTIGTLVNAWGFGPKKSIKNITPKQIDSLLHYVNFQNISLTKNKTIRKKYLEMYLDFNAIAQGYSVDVVLDFLIKKGIKNALVEVGGELKSVGSNTINHKKWSVGIDDPTQTPENRKLIAKINLENLGMATSGNYRKIKIDSLTGKKYVHILNPKTGYPEQTNILSATVVAPSTALADGYATTFMLFSLNQTQEFLKNHPELYVMVVYQNNKGGIEIFQSENFKNLQATN